jgi:peptidoglycan hydrolase FlgJ
VAANDIPSNARSLALDPRGLDRLRTSAGATPEKALREAAKQFEVLFMNMLLKSMRDAAPQDGPMDSDQTRMYTSMLDQQLAQNMASRGVGLADVMVRQLSRNAATVSAEKALGMSGASSASDTAPVTDKPAAQSPTEATGPRSSIASRSREFVNRMWPHALEASRETGLPAHFILGQAALESGWGARETRGPDGAPTFNLFNIKAGQSWRGESAEAPTTEYVGGTAQKMSARFRSYGSYAEAFKDYASLLKSNSRYSGVLQSGSDPAQFARELQKAGYATDPDYASKLTRVITGSVLRGGLST